MYRLTLSAVLFAIAVLPARSHFVWIVPEGTAANKAKIVFSDDLSPDDAVEIDKIAQTKLLLRDAAGKESPVTWKKIEHAFEINVPEKGALAIGGVCRYGVFQRGDNPPFLLNYYPKFARGESAAKAWDKQPFEIVARGAGKFQVLFAGKPLPDSEVIVVTPSEAKGTFKTDKAGEVTLKSAAPGTYGIRAKHVEAKAGELDGKKFNETRHYATLVYRVEGDKKSAGAFPDLPIAVSSFGAAVEDGFVYIYGGHRAKTHEYSTEAVVGTFHRLRLAEPKAWESLPSGPGLQGLAVVAHQGKIYRIGGMQPKNKPGDKADNHSVATCARFDPKSGKWEAIPDMPEPRSSHDAVVIRNQLIVVGGWALNGTGKKSDWHTTTLIMDLDKKPLAWRSVKQPFERRALTTAEHDGKVYVVAGIGTDGIESTIDIFDPAKNEWTTGPKMPGPRRNGFSPAAISVAGKFYVNGSDGKVYVLNGKGEWNDVGQVAQPRIVHRLVAVDRYALLALGGAAKGSNVSATEAVALPRETSLRIER